jgi:hypothetical protein
VPVTKPPRRSLPPGSDGDPVRIEAYDPTYRERLITCELASHIQIPSPVACRRDTAHAPIEPGSCHKGRIHCPPRCEPHQVIRYGAVVANEGPAHIQIPGPVSSRHDAQNSIIEPRGLVKLGAKRSSATAVPNHFRMPRPPESVPQPGQLRISVRFSFDPSVTSRAQLGKASCQATVRL